MCFPSRTDVAKMEGCTIGGPFDDPPPDLCGMVSRDHLEKVSRMVERAREAGATVLCGGHIMEGGGPAYRYAPTVLADVDQKSEVVQREIFGPVVPVLRFDTFDEALDLANDCEYGLASSIFTEDYRLIERARTELLFGETYVNRFHFEAIQGFHAGWRKSGIGGADGKHGFLEYLFSRSLSTSSSEALNLFFSDVGTSATIGGDGAEPNLGSNWEHASHSASWWGALTKTAGNREQL